MTDYTSLLSQVGAGLVGAFVLYLIRRFQDNDMIPFASRDSNRTRVLSSLARISQLFGGFYRIVRSPEQTLRRGQTDLNISYLLTTYWWYPPIMVLILYNAVTTHDISSPFFTFIQEMEVLGFLLAVLHPSTRAMTRFWGSYGEQVPRRRWAALFATYRAANDVVVYLVFGILISLFGVILRAFLQKADLAGLISGYVSYEILAGVAADAIAIMIFRLVYFGGIHRIEDFAFSRYFLGSPVSVELILKDADKTQEGRPQGTVTSIGSSMALERQDGLREEFHWQDIRRIASRWGIAA